MAVNGTINKTSFTDATAIQNGSSPLNAKSVHVQELRNAITRLESYVTNVDNCGNCVFCQTCQGCQSCQTCQQCESQCSCYS